MTNEEMLSEYLTEARDTAEELLGMLSRTNAVPELGGAVKQVSDYLNFGGPFYREDVLERRRTVNSHAEAISRRRAYVDMMPAGTRACVVTLSDLMERVAHYAPTSASRGETP